MPKRVVVGAHYGWRDWLVQRVTAVVMALYTLLVVILVVRNGGLYDPLRTDIVKNCS